MEERKYNPAFIAALKGIQEALEKPKGEPKVAKASHMGFHIEVEIEEEG